MAFFIGSNNFSAKYLYVLTHTGGVYCTSRYTWPLLFFDRVRAFYRAIKNQVGLKDDRKTNC